MKNSCDVKGSEIGYDFRAGTMWKRLTLEGLWLAASNVVLTAFFGWFAFVHAIAFVIHHRLSLGLILFKELLDVFFVLTKRRARGTSRSVLAWGLAFSGTLCPLLFRPANAPHDHSIAVVLQAAGVLLQVCSLFSLNRSFGIVPANRGVQGRGMYRYVRHPLYMSYVINQIGYVLNHPTSWNILIFSAATLLQVLRIFQEERYLEADPEYRAYRERTRWRLLPYFF
jgi:protein-S-isoprenylcysteine O-methyltransferase Ste14